MDAEVDVKSMTIDDLFEQGAISVRLHNSLVLNGFSSVEQVLDVPSYDFKKFPKMGETTTNELFFIISEIIPEDEHEKYPFFKTEGLAIPASVFDVPIAQLGFTARTTNSLLRAGYELLGDLYGETESALAAKCRGMGSKCLDEIFHSSKIDDYVFRFKIIRTLSPFEQLKYCSTISDYAKNNFSEKYYDMFCSQYIEGSMPAYVRYGISRQAVHQKVGKVIKGLKNGFSSNEIAPYIFDAFYAKARRGLLLNDGHDFDALFTNTSVARILNAVFPGKFRIKRSTSLRHLWCFTDDVDVDSEIGGIRDFINERVYCSVEELRSAFSGREELIEDITFIYKYGDFYSRTSSESYFNVYKYIKERGNQTFSVYDIENRFGYDDRYIRRILLRLPNIENVGLSKYRYVGEASGVSDYSTVGIMVNLLKESGKPLSRDVLVDGVLKIRDINRSSVIQAIYANNDTFTEIEGDLVALTEWGYTPKEYDHISYENKLDDVVLSILRSSYFPLTIKDIAEEIKRDYGDTASSNPVSIHAAITKLSTTHNIIRAMHGLEASYYLDEESD